MELQDIYKKGRKVSYQFGDDTGWVRYRPDRATNQNGLDWQEKLNEAQKEGDAAYVQVLNEQLVDYISEWDMTLNGEPLPVDATVMAMLPVQLKNALRMAIFSDTGEAEKKGKKTSSMTG